ncbi:MAG: peroxiredoxin [Haloarculaceae archaeon]
MVLATGEQAPTVSAPNQDGRRVQIEGEEPTVVYFYPRDNTKGCTIEAQQFDAEYETYREAGVDVYGVSTDDVDAHERFADQYDLGFDLLADPEGDLAAAFDVPIDDGAAARTTFVLAGGKVVAVYEGVRPDGHARDVLRDLAEAGIAALE